MSTENAYLPSIPNLNSADTSQYTRSYEIVHASVFVIIETKFNGQPVNCFLFIMYYIGEKTVIFYIKPIYIYAMYLYRI